MSKSGDSEQVSTHPRVADELARSLFECGLRHAFGVPGGEVLTVIDALTQAGIAFHAARHESAAGFMAEGAAAGSASPGLMVATLGPGASNAVNVAAHAQQEAFPLIVIAGQVSTAEDPAYTHQVLDQWSLFAPVTKTRHRLSEESVADQVHRLVEVACAEPRGPVYLECPMDVVDQITTAGTCPAEAQGEPKASGCGSPGPIDVVTASALATAMERAQRPLVIAGRNALRSGVAPALSELADVRQVPVLTTYRAKGLYDENRRQSLGAAGLSPRADSRLLPFVADADLILLLGYDPIEMRRNWIRPFGSSQELAVIGTGGTVPGYDVHYDLEEADIAATLDFLTAQMRGQEYSLSEEASSLRRALDDDFQPKGDWSPGHLFAELQDLATEGPMRVAVDTGAHRILFGQQWKSRDPEGILQSTGLCTMACALPLGIGAALADRMHPVIAIVGDGGLEMGLGELATARDLEVPLVIIVIDDAGYGLIDMKQRARGFASQGVRLGRSDYAGVARAIGIEGQRCTGSNDFRQAMRSAMKGTTPSLIHAPFSAETYDGRI